MFYGYLDPSAAGFFCFFLFVFLWRGGEWDADIRFTFLVHAYINGNISRQQLHCSLQVDSASTLE